jgi:hypothetical protein
MFSKAVQLNFDSIAMMMMLKFESALLRSANVTVPIILASLRSKESITSEIKLSLLQILQPSFLFKHADGLVEIFEFMNRKAF